MNIVKTIMIPFWVATFILQATADGRLLVHWRFEQIQNLNGEIVPSVVGEPLTANERGPVDPQPFVYDDAGNGNVLQVQGSHSDRKSVV